MSYTEKPMTTMQEFRCEVCGTKTSHPIHWFVIQCGDLELSVRRWSTETANAAGARHFCGERHAEIYISRWFDSMCSPPRPDYNVASPAE
ncbi:MAG TPA: hypothetical protein VND65_08655 [Candidatus Binatia bacterium]|nr:hypothetical protein [Candidatus Binatia bacterium]